MIKGHNFFRRLFYVTVITGSLAGVMTGGSVVMAEESGVENPSENDAPSMEEVQAMSDEEREALFKSMGIEVDENAPEIIEDVSHIACIGDSITYGMGVQSRKTEAWPAVLDTLLPDDWQVLNYGLSGRTLLAEGDEPYTEEDFYTISHEANADIYIIMLGTNDSKPYNWNAENYRTELTDFAKSYSELESNPTVYLMIPSKCFVIDGNEDVEFDISDDVIHNEIANIIQEVAEENDYPVIDLYSYTENHPEWFGDGVHPNAEGNAEIAAYIDKCLAID